MHLLAETLKCRDADAHKIDLNRAKSPRLLVSQWRMAALLLVKVREVEGREASPTAAIIIRRL